MAFSHAIARMTSSVLEIFADAVVSRDGVEDCRGVFDHRAIVDDVLSDIPSSHGGGMYSGPVPMLTLAAADADGLVHGSALSVDGVGYTVRDTQPDGTGLVRVMLKKA